MAEHSFSCRSLGPDGKRQYTLKKVTSSGVPTRSAHPGTFPPPFSCAEQTRSTTDTGRVSYQNPRLPPARFSPDDKYSRHRVTIKKRCAHTPLSYTNVAARLTAHSMFFLYSRNVCSCSQPVRVWRMLLLTSPRSRSPSQPLDPATSTGSLSHPLFPRPGPRLFVFYLSWTRSLHAVPCIPASAPACVSRTGSRAVPGSAR